MGVPHFTGNDRAGFVASRNGVVSNNLIVFDSAHWSEGGVNVGAGVDAESFRFEGNHWFCTDRPDRSRPRLPTTERGGVYGVDPQFHNEEQLDLRLKPGSPASDRGAGAFAAP
jgi:hypothetical protein